MSSSGLPTLHLAQSDLRHKCKGYEDRWDRLGCVVVQCRWEEVPGVHLPDLLHLGRGVGWLGPG